MDTDRHIEGTSARYWHRIDDGRLQCDLCPRFCKLRDKQRGLCFVRARSGDNLVLTTYGRSSGFCVDPIEKKPLNHFLPGTPVLSFGTAGCNLACKFCQNWDITKSREFDRLQAEAQPGAIALAAVDSGSRSVAYTYNDPVIFLEYAVDVAHACRERGLANVAVTAGYITDDAREEFFEPMHAVNVDLKAFTDDFYWKMMDTPSTPRSTLTRSRDIARRNGLHYVYTGNVYDPEGSSTYCPGCGGTLIERMGYELGAWNISVEDGRAGCTACGSRVAGVFEDRPGNWGSRRQPLRIN